MKFEQYIEQLKLSLITQGVDFNNNPSRITSYVTEHSRQADTIEFPLCPINRQISLDPVKLVMEVNDETLEETCYDRVAITNWVRQNNNSPLSRASCALTDIKHDTVAKKSIKLFLMQNPAWFLWNIEVYFEAKKTLGYEQITQNFEKFVVDTLKMLEIEVVNYDEKRCDLFDSEEELPVAPPNAQVQMPVVVNRPVPMQQLLNINPDLDLLPNNHIQNPRNLENDALLQDYMKNDLKNIYNQL